MLPRGRRSRAGGTLAAMAGVLPLGLRPGLSGDLLREDTDAVCLEEPTKLGMSRDAPWGEAFAPACAACTVVMSMFAQTIFTVSRWATSGLGNCRALSSTTRGSALRTCRIKKCTSVLPSCLAKLIVWPMPSARGSPLGTGSRSMQRRLPLLLVMTREEFPQLAVAMSKCVLETQKRRMGSGNHASKCCGWWWRPTCVVPSSRGNSRRSAGREARSSTPSAWMQRRRQATAVTLQLAPPELGAPEPAEVLSDFTSCGEDSILTTG
mmetsp:Transcript_32425/g.87926  ORF Transcript_32425/g.87926 Transcript_32425/m.87926 type:complete len:265 (+) Transcript_32425:895-1689(+)